MPASAEPSDPADFQDPAYREAVVELLGAISYALNHAG